MWTRIWHVAGRTAELREPGDYVVHHFTHASVFCVRQNDGSIKAFYNTCGHRGQRLVWNSASVNDGFHCPYHGWVWGKDGVPRTHRIVTISRRATRVASASSRICVATPGAASSGIR